LDREVESLKVEVRYLNEGQKDLKEEIKLLRQEMKGVSEFITEARYGKTYLLWLLTAAATLGALIDYLCRLIKLY
jgi:hypothetical protein